MRTFRVFSLIALAVLLLAMIAANPAMAQNRDDIYIIGVMEPMNKTELPGHIDFPYYVEVMDNILSAPPNNYVIKRIGADELEKAGYRFSSIKADVDIQPNQVQALCDQNRLDAVLTGKVEQLEGNLEPRFLAEAGRFLDFKIEGILYDRSGRKIWNKSVDAHYEFARKEGKFRPPFQTQVVDLYVSKTKELATGLIDRIGTKVTDREPPTIQFENIRSGDKIKTSCIILKGLVSDNSKVDSITVNGQDFPLRKPEKNVEMFYPVQVPHGKPGQRVTVTIEAKDIYGYSYAKELDLKWDTSVKGVVTSLNPGSVSIGLSDADFKRTSVGMGFWIYSVDEFRDPLSSSRMRMFTVDKVGPVVIIKRFPDKNVVQAKFLKGQEALIDQVKKDDIAK
ncbi:MAG: hypothetical protein LWY06_17785 [Firmicutes bacterium]|nr:hypothetical protein [Bacillota bacterium]